MRNINFLLIFALVLVLALFSLENSELVTVQIIPGTEVQLPLSIEIIVAMGIGAFFTWMFTLWTGLQRAITDFSEYRKIKAKDRKVNDFKPDMEQLEAEIEKKTKFLPEGESIDEKART